MWTCSKCNTEVKDQFDNCPVCGTGRDGSAPPVDFVKKGDAFQPRLPVAEKGTKRMMSILIAVAVILVLILIGLSKSS